MMDDAEGTRVEGARVGGTRNVEKATRVSVKHVIAMRSISSGRPAPAAGKAIRVRSSAKRPGPRSSAG
jgi:hypothetical protein